ncbi:hypothetical protein MPSEU_000373900 [Mayamaea pseudoterrestris]|nr:hypothetical protein MPSEU_000373900 [Mayamaea pseudoterrestris]
MSDFEMKQRHKQVNSKSSLATHQASICKNGRLSSTKNSTKFAKPKHLKRKLETMSPDDPRHNEVLGQLQDFEEKKQLFSGKGMTKTPRLPRRPTQDEEQLSHTPKAATPPTGIGKDASNYAHKDDKPTRQRGQRRRGRKDTTSVSLVVAVGQAEMPIVSEASEASLPMAAMKPPLTELDKSSIVREPKRRSIQRLGDPRYCVGRKPVSDFEIGSKHSGKVVYVKPFGVFFDIGCHSDAFCHVSRLSDDFVENPETVFRPGDDVENIRIVETDRQKKRITVSLQSDMKIKAEKLSLESRLERMKKRKPNGRSNVAMLKGSKSSTGTVAHEKEANSVELAKLADSEPLFGGSINADTYSSARELKRRQKLQRRAARREQHVLQ